MKKRKRQKRKSCYNCGYYTRFYGGEGTWDDKFHCFWGLIEKSKWKTPTKIAENCPKYEKAVITDEVLKEEV